MSIKINAYAGPHTSYSEMGQSNLLRWTVLFKEDNGSYTETTRKFKCKDFFNEVIAVRHGHDLGCYGFSAESVKINEDGVYCLMTSVSNQDAFEHNLGSINVYAEKSGMPALSWQRNGKDEILFMPMAYFDNTYFASLLTYMIRVSNVDSKFVDFLTHPTRKIDSPFEAHYDKAFAGGFKLPIDVKSYYYVGPKNDYSKQPPVMYVHNCGVRQWWDCAITGQQKLGI